MGVSFYIDLVTVESAKKFPFFNLVLENSANIENVFGKECYVLETVEREYEFDYGVGIDSEKEKEQFRKEIEEEYYLDEGDEIDDYDYMRYMIECCKEVESHCFSVDC